MPHHSIPGCVMRKRVKFVVSLPLFYVVLHSWALNDESRPAPREDDPTKTNYSWRFVPVDAQGDKVQILIQRAPTFVHSLEMAPVGLERKLSHGKWLVMACGVFSQNDRNCIKTAIEATERFRGQVQL